MSDEIKSTLEKVMERLAAMDAAGSTSGAVSDEEQVKEGMRLAASFMRDELPDLAGRLAGLPAAEQRPVRQGVLRTLLRNIFLPRHEEQLAPAEKAMNGLVAVGQSDRELLMVFGDMKKILDQYLQHRKQLKKQLADQFAQQLAMMEGNLARQTGVPMKLSPEQHPKFQEEWMRIQEELDGQYGRALEQHKKLVEQRLS